MAKDYKYEDSTPVDEPIRKGKVKAVEPGSDIRVDGKPLKAEGYAKPPAERANRNPAEGFARPPSSDAETSKTNAMGDTYAKGGMTASSRGDGIAQRGKTKGTMVMCGGGYAKGKK
jgi:hypothetical protein